MHKIFYGNRCLLICDSNERAGGELCDCSDLEAGELAGRLTSCSEGPNIVVRAGDAEAVYEAVCRSFKQVNAAGGLVSGDGGKKMMIHRNGVWDLPKGHQEEGEDIGDTAVREIREETGVSGLTNNGLICITDHCYFRNGIWHLKHTWWYDFSCVGNAVTIPQTEEGISEAVWISAQDVPALLADSYPSIREVFASAKK